MLNPFSPISQGWSWNNVIRSKSCLHSWHNFHSCNTFQVFLNVASIYQIFLLEWWKSWKNMSWMSYFWRYFFCNQMWTQRATLYHFNSSNTNINFHFWLLPQSCWDAILRSFWKRLGLVLPVEWYVVHYNHHDYSWLWRLLSRHPLRQMYRSYRLLMGQFFGLHYGCFSHFLLRVHSSTKESLWPH